MSRTKVIVLRAVPILGWVTLVAGVPYAQGKKPWPHPSARVVWWIDLFLSVVVHGLQVPVAFRQRHVTGHSRGRTAIMTFIFGLTYWKTVSPQVAADPTQPDTSS
ncbi:MAG: hypothetical protein GX542_12910 [Rhodococcus sp.]|nr:hypothetical protein [Rhodococcus sp. (in: high G+C Gram-positive bacteria)]